MTERSLTAAEVEAKARAEYQAAPEPGQPQLPWEDLPEYRRAFWREIVRGNAGAAEG